MQKRRYQTLILTTLRSSIFNNVKPRGFIFGLRMSSIAQGQIRLPKNQLVSCLLGCFDSDRIFLSKRLRELDAMLEELQEFEIKIRDDGRESFNAKIGSHDDLLCALGIAAWCGESDLYEPIKMW